MKIVAWSFLILIFATPVLVAEWWLFPIVAGVCVWALIKFGDAKYVGKVIKPVLLVLLLIFVIWLGFVFRRRSLPHSYENSSAAHALRIVSPRARQSSLQSPQLQRERQLLADGIVRERLKIMDIGEALELSNSADQISVAQKKGGVTDESGLRSALDGLGKQLASHKREDGSSTPDLMEPANLKDLVQRANAALDKMKEEADQPEVTADQISEKRNRLPKLVFPFEVDPLYGQTANVQNALRLTLKADLSPVSTYSFSYDRQSDTLTCEQSTLIILAGQQPIAVDVTAFRSGIVAPLREEILLREDSQAEKEVPPTEHGLPLHPETQRLTLIRRVRRPRASYPLITDRVWIPFSGITLSWPIPLSSSVVLSVRLPEDPAITWPLAVPIRTNATAAMNAAYLPPSSFFYSDAPLAPSLQGDSDAGWEQLVPSQGVPTMADLAIDKEIHLELLPRYLSFPALQRSRSFLFVENVGMAVLLALVACVGTLLPSPPK